MMFPLVRTTRPVLQYAVRYRASCKRLDLASAVTVQGQDILCRNKSRFHAVKAKLKKTEEDSSGDKKVGHGGLSLMAEMLLAEKAPPPSTEPTIFEDDFKELEDLSKAEIEMPNMDTAIASIDDDEALDVNSEDLSRDMIGSRDLDRKARLSLPRDNSVVELYGGPDPEIPISDVPCPGCGALLHCQDPGIPGYMPSQKFTAIPEKELRNYRCQRCILFVTHNIALNVTVSPDEYRTILSSVRFIRALAVLVVDVTDMTNSILRDLPSLIGPKRPLYVIGNKVDLLPKDGEGYLRRTQEALEKICHDVGLSKSNPIKHTCLISAKTGYGVEELVTVLMKEWNRQGHVYVMGCTNVGKSTLFNALLMSDYCKSTARDSFHRATTSLWPGTTLNLLKFPVIDPVPWRLKRRAERLLRQRSDEVEEERLRKEKLKETKKTIYATLMGHVGQTFLGNRDHLAETQEYKGYDNATYSFDTLSGSVEDTAAGYEDVRADFEKRILAFDEKRYRESRWCHDTPGVVNPQQIINILSQTELSVMLAKRIIRPRSFVLKPTQVLFVTGLGRLDYVKGPKSIYATVFASSSLPIHVVDGSKAEDFYSEHIGSQKLGVPLGSRDRLNEIPSLVGREFSLTGIGWDVSMADITLSSIGWVALTAGRGMDITVRGFTPGSYGLGLRTPALLQYAVSKRGKRVRGTSEYQVRKLLA